MRTKFTKITLTAFLALAITFTLSCSSDDDPTPPINGSGNTLNNPGFTSNATCGNKLMSENLNVDVTGSKCYNNDPANCEKYGRLYDWATAMKLPAKCNITSSQSISDSDCDIELKHQGICPSGWHIPTIDELNQYGSYECLSNQKGGISYAGIFNLAGKTGHWWSKSEYISTYAYSRYVDRIDEGASSYFYNKSDLYSVRCVQDYSSNEDVQKNGCPNVSNEINTMSCGGQTYKIVEIGNQTWMAENLNYDVTGSKCYDNNTFNCAKYGRLYNWATVMDIDQSYNKKIFAANPKHQGICPSGWHIPGYDDWQKLIDYVESNQGCSWCAGTYLRGGSEIEWKHNGYPPEVNILNTYGFSALPGGGGASLSGVDYFHNYGNGYWWSSDEYGSKDRAYHREMDFQASFFSRRLDKYNLYSVRCIKD